LVGKAPASDLVIDDGLHLDEPRADRHRRVGQLQHLRSQLHDGTYVNGVRVNEALLYHGNSVRFGSTEMRTWHNRESTMR